MKKHSIIQHLGLGLILLSLILLIGSKGLDLYLRKQTQQLARHLEALLPLAGTGTPDDYSSAELPVLQLDGEDFSGLIRIPSFGVTLPMGHSWSSTGKYPCRFWGSLYDGTLVVGGKDKTGQLDFCDRMDIGEQILITDMTGVQFRYTVSRIDRSRHADADILLKDEWDLTLFVRDAISLDYILIRCNYS